MGWLAVCAAAIWLLSSPRSVLAADAPPQAGASQPAETAEGSVGAEPSSAASGVEATPPTPSPTPSADKPAEKPSGDETAAARKLFGKGVAMADREKWEEAAKSFRLSLALRPSPVTAYNLAAAFSGLGRVVEAARILRGVVWDRTANDDVRSAARQLLKTTMTRVGWLTVRLLGDVRDVHVTIDYSAEVFQGFGIPIPLNPGVHAITLYRPGHRPARHKVRIEEHGSHHLLLDVPIKTTAGSAAVEGLSAAGDRDSDAGRSDDGNLLSNPWFWAAPGALVVSAIVVGVLWASSN